MCVIILILYLLYPGTRIHPNQILINHAWVVIGYVECRFADSLFAVAFLISRRLFLIGDTTCSSSLGLFASFLTQYSLMASETSYLFLAIDGLISVSRPFTDTQTRYTLFGFGMVSSPLAMGSLSTPWDWFPHWSCLPPTKRENMWSTFAGFKVERPTSTCLSVRCWSV